MAEAGTALCGQLIYGPGLETMLSTDQCRVTAAIKGRCRTGRRVPSSRTSISNLYEGRPNQTSEDIAIVATQNHLGVLVGVWRRNIRKLGILVANISSRRLHTVISGQKMKHTISVSPLSHARKVQAGAMQDMKGKAKGTRGMIEGQKTPSS